MNYNSINDVLTARGILLLDAEQVDESSALVLCKYNDEYVIWSYMLETGATVYGHYYTALDKAVAVYVKKVEEVTL
jgi:hypothetical protein